MLFSSRYIRARFSNARLFNSRIFHASIQLGLGGMKKFGLGAIPALLLAASFSFSPLAAETIKIKRTEYENCIIQTAPGFEARAADIQARMVAGFKRLYSLFENPPLKAGKPSFWLLSSADEMRTVLEQKQFRLKPEEIKEAVRLGAYRDDVNIFVRVDPTIPEDWLLRILYTEYVRSLMDALAPSAMKYRIGWFYAGMSSYLAWMVLGEQDSQARALYEKYIFLYYGRQFHPEQYTPLQLLEVPADWRSALRRNSRAVFSQAVLTYLYLAKQKGPTVGIVILRNFHRETAFQTAFERSTGLKLKAFEKEVSEKLFPQVRELHKKTRRPGQPKPKVAQ